MIDRYSTIEMLDLFSPETQMKQWHEVECAAAQAQGAPEAVRNELDRSRVPDVLDVEHEELTTRHDVVAFLNVWRRSLSPEASAWVHKGMTSSDLVDTANAIRLKEATYFILESLVDLRATLAEHATAHRYTYRVGRTHGQTAELTTWGHRVAEFAIATNRAIRRFNRLSAGWHTGKLNGPVGTYSRIQPEHEREAMDQLGLWVPDVTSQIVMRDVYADYVFCCAQAATAVEALALEVRLSSRSDTGEVAEGMGAKAQGSSSMPHKRNPIKAEQLCGLARLVRAHIEPVMQGVASHHERDISHSSVERVALADVSALTHYMVKAAKNLVENLAVNAQVMLDRATAQTATLLTANLREQLIGQGIEADRAWWLVAAAADHEPTSDQVLINALRAEYSTIKLDTDPPLDFHAMVTNRPKLHDDHVFDSLLSAWF